MHGHLLGVLSVSLFPQDNTEILGYLLGGIAALGSWASRIPQLSRIVSLGPGLWVPAGLVSGHLGASSQLQVTGVERWCLRSHVRMWVCTWVCVRVYTCVRAADSRPQASGGPEAHRERALCSLHFS